MQQQQPGRLRLRPWLEEQIQSGRYPGVSWLDQSARIFQIPWKHAARHEWSIDRDATLFRSWAMHTGRYHPGKDQPDPKTWKANFRCALNSLPDVCELREHSRKRGSDAFRVYRMLPSSQSHGRRRGLRPFNRQRDKKSSLDVHRQDDTTQSWQSPTGTDSDTHEQVDTAAEDTFKMTRGLWETKTEDQEQSEAVFKLMDHFSNADIWNQTGDQRGWRTQTLWDHWHCAGDDNLYLLHSENYSDLFGPGHVKEFPNWSTHQQL